MLAVPLNGQGLAKRLRHIILLVELIMEARLEEVLHPRSQPNNVTSTILYSALFHVPQAIDNKLWRSQCETIYSPFQRFNRFSVYSNLIHIIRTE